ncbi:MAG TPA: VOC family protein [Acetobacteraceae bacterium]|nr:VOC family protein [Acetobacteraceae bacterium]
MPLIDHVIVNIGDRMDEAVDAYSRLGFSLTPRGRHTLGSINHLAMFGADYLELLGVPMGEAPPTNVIAESKGLGAVAFATDDADGVHAALTGAGLGVMAPLPFSRPVTLPDGVREAAFRVARVAPEATDAGRLFFCQHLTRGVVWRDEWRRHPNGVLGVLGVIVAARRPESLGALFARMFGDAAVVKRPGGVRLLAGLASIDVLAPAQVARRYNDMAPMPEGREAAMVALVLRVAAIDRCAAALRAGGIAGADVAADRIVVPAAEAMGVALEFRVT